VTADRLEDRDESLSELFSTVARRLRRLSRDTVQPWDINPSQSRALGTIARHGVMRLRDLSEHLSIAPRSTTEVIDGLEARGLVERKPDPIDRRATLVGLTKHGREVSDAIRQAGRAEAERIFGSLSAADRAYLSRILRQLRDEPGPER
jgi:DNA-binding MarR family transcriptional regulator